MFYDETFDNNLTSIYLMAEPPILMNNGVLSFALSQIRDNIVVVSRLYAIE
jgi:hypothetical protein